jgi:hypothetical protein
VLKWTGFLLSLAVLGLALAWTSQFMQPFEKGNAAVFWSGVAAVPLQHEGHRHRLYPRQNEPYLYNPSCSNGFWLHGDHWAAVSETEALAMFPRVLDLLIEDPSALTTGEIEALLGEDFADRAEALKKLAAQRDEIGKSAEKLQAFLWAAYEADLRETPQLREPNQCVLAIMDAQFTGARLDRARRYWMNIVFEAVFLGGVVTLFWLPLLWSRMRRWLPLVWGGLPMFILLPYFFGYCRAAMFWPDPTFWGGPLYSWIIVNLRPLTDNMLQWDANFLDYFPRILDFLNQPSFLDFETDHIMGIVVPRVGPVVPLIFCLVITSILYGIRWVLGRRAGKN